MTDVYPFLSGAATAMFVLGGLFFLRSWKRSGNSFFIAFAFAFWLLALNQALSSLADIPVEERSWIYLLRLGAFLLIIVSIWRKNRRG